MASIAAMTLKITVLSVILIAFSLLFGCEEPKLTNTLAPTSLLRVSADGKYGYMDTNGRIVIAPCYQVKTGEFQEGLAAVPEDCHDKEKWGYIDISGQFVIAPQFRAANSFSEGLAAVQVGDNWGFINKAGDIVIPTTYMSVCNFSEGMACVRQCGDYEGNYTCPYGYIDKHGKTVIAPFTTHPSDFSEGFALVKIGEQFKYIDSNGKIVIEVGFDFSAGNFSQGMAKVRQDNKFGYIDKSGKMVIRANFEAAGDFSEGLAYASIDGKYGFIDRSGTFVIPPKYDLILDGIGFNDGIACVGMGDQDEEKFYYINKNGKRIFPTSFSWCGNFEDNIAQVEKSGISTYINKNGDILWSGDR